MNASPHWFVLGALALACVQFGAHQNRGKAIGGPISLPKILWLNIALALFLIMPLFLWRNGTLSPAVREIYSWLWLSFIVRGILEMYLIYVAVAWKCIYGIAHNAFTLGLAILLSATIFNSPTSAVDARALEFLPLYATCLTVESFFAWRFSKLASPADGIYFAADTEHFQFINRVTWAVLAVVYPWFAWFLWRTRADFSWSEW